MGGVRGVTHGSGGLAYGDFQGYGGSELHFVDSQRYIGKTSIPRVIGGRKKKASRKRSPKALRKIQSDIFCASSDEDIG